MKCQLLLPIAEGRIAFSTRSLSSFSVIQVGTQRLRSIALRVFAPSRFTGAMTPALSPSTRCPAQAAILSLILLACAWACSARAAAPGEDMANVVMTEVQAGLKRLFPKANLLTTQVDPPRRIGDTAASFRAAFVLTGVTEEISPRKVESWVPHFDPLVERTKALFPGAKISTWRRFIHAAYVQNAGRENIPGFSILLSQADATDRTYLDLRVDFIERGDGMVVVSCSLVSALSPKPDADKKL